MGKRLTSGYTIVVHDVTTTTIKLWIGALTPSMGKPHNWRLVLRKCDTEAHRNHYFADV